MLSIAEASSEAHVGSEVSVRGWVYRIRSSGGVTFIVIRDSTGIVQCTAKKNELTPEQYDEISSLGIESSLSLIGTMKKDLDPQQDTKYLFISLRYIRKTMFFPSLRIREKSFCWTTGTFG